MLIRNATTRVALNATDITRATDTPSSVTSALVLLTTDALYLAYKKPFASRYFQFGTLNVNAATLTVEYWNGSDFAAVEDIIDQTQGFTANGFVAWVNKTDWQTRQVAPWADAELYWLRIKVSANLSAGTTIQAILNLFTDDDLLSRHYPELVSNTSYLPPGKTNFLEQHVAAADMVITRLKQDQIILDEAQIIDPNQVALSAVHFLAFVILNPIVTTTEERERTDRAKRDGNAELNKVRISLDLNEDGRIDPAEVGDGNLFLARGG